MFTGGIITLLEAALGWGEGGFMFSDGRGLYFGCVSQSLCNPRQRRLHLRLTFTVVFLFESLSLVGTGW